MHTESTVRVCTCFILLLLHTHTCMHICTLTHTHADCCGCVVVRLIYLNLSILFSFIRRLCIPMLSHSLVLSYDVCCYSMNWQYSNCVYVLFFFLYIQFLFVLLLLLIRMFNVISLFLLCSTDIFLYEVKFVFMILTKRQSNYLHGCG